MKHTCVKQHDEETWKERFSWINSLTSNIFILFIPFHTIIQTLFDLIYNLMEFVSKTLV